MITITASLMCANIQNIGKDIVLLERAGTDWFHIDVMDGNFVSNYALSLSNIEDIRKLTSLPFDVHLMVNESIRYIEKLSEIGSDTFIVQAEACNDLQATIDKIKGYDKKVGVALNPLTPTKAIEHVLDRIDIALFMAVNPGFAGQKFIPEVVSKINQFYRLIKEKRLNIDIMVDGHVGPDTIPMLARAGANIFVGGTTSLFNGKVSFKEGIEQMRYLAEKNYIGNIKASKEILRREV